MTDTKLLNKLLNTKQKLAKERATFPNNCRLTELLDKLIKNKYNFTREEVDLFIEQACCENRYGYTYIGTINDIFKNITVYMLSIYDLTEAQIDRICSDRNTARNNINHCIDILFNKKYNFTDERFHDLILRQYYNPPIDKYDSLHNNIIYAGCMNIMTTPRYTETPNYTNFKKCIDLLSQTKNPFTIQYFDIILLCLEKFTNTPFSFSNNLTKLLNVFFKFEKNTDIFKIVIEKIVPTCFNHILIIEYIINKLEYDDKFLEYVLKEIVPNNPKIILNLALNDYKVTLNDLNSMLNNSDHISLPANDTNIYRAINLPPEFFKAFPLINSKIKIPIVKLFGKFNIIPNIDTLNSICKLKQINEMKILLDEYKLIPEKSTLDICVGTLCYDLIVEVLKYRLTPDNKTLHSLSMHNLWQASEQIKVYTIMELLIKFGLTINLADIDYLLSKRYVLENLERFNIPYDEHLYFICYLHNHYPKEYIEKFTIDKNVLKMHQMCREGRVYELSKLLRDTDTKLDRYAMDILLLSNSTFADNYIEKGCMPSIISIYKCTKAPSLIKYILDTHKITTYDMLEPYNIKF